MKLPFCVACLAHEDLHHHHLVPKTKGGTDEDKNLITLCHTCHRNLHGMTGEWGNHRELTKSGMKKLKGSGKVWTFKAYGWDFKDGKATENKKEQQAIKWMVKLRDQGLSYGEIIAKLHEKKIFAKGGGLWCIKSLSRIIKKGQEAS